MSNNLPDPLAATPLVAALTDAWERHPPHDLRVRLGTEALHLRPYELRHAYRTSSCGISVHVHPAPVVDLITVEPGVPSVDDNATVSWTAGHVRFERGEHSAEVPLPVLASALKDSDGLLLKAFKAFLQGWTLRWENTDVPEDGERSELLRVLDTATVPAALADALQDLLHHQPFVRTLATREGLLLLGAVPGYVHAHLAQDVAELQATASRLQQVLLPTPC
ncbi:hypothetical protein [Deinococcus aluminii]|uniref:Uncharacterized protein n=1 Tax=Deinococcus aluminii TaxID=1656885 RepID=A0ABP9XFC9_9DEIO